MSMIGTGLSALIAAQRGLEATSNNVANAGTDGYVRRRIAQSEAVSVGAGLTADIGSGVRVTGVDRIYDAFLTDALRSATSTAQRSTALADMTARLDTLLGNPDLGINNSLQAFFDQVELLAREPTSASNRQQLLDQGDALTQRFRQLGVQLDALGDEVDRRLQASATRINNIAASLAQINASIGRGTSGGNDLADQRDALLAQLTEQIDATVILQGDGTVAVTVANGQPLVLGINSAQLALTADQFDPTRQQLVINLGTESRPIARLVSGGVVGGLLAFRDEALDPARRELGLLATGLASAFNAQHAQGVDANGNLGQDFFAVTQPTALASARNTGTATLSVAISDATALQARDYELRYTGSGWALTDAATGQAVSMSGAGTAIDPFTFEGVAVTVSAGAAANDRFLVRPVAGAAGSFSLAIGSASAIAAAAPVVTGRSLANSSAAAIALAGVSDAGNPALGQPVDIRFESPTSFRIYDAANTDLSGPLAYSSGADIDFNGWTVRISGTAATGDSFSVRPMPPGSGDNANALGLAQVGTNGYLDGGRLSPDALAARLLANVGARALRSRQDMDVQTALQEQTEVDLEAASGVNLDEEAANLLRYQQAYQAASKVIGISDELFRTLLGALA